MLAVGGELWLPAMMEALVARGITRLLVEGGPRYVARVREPRLVDEVVLYMAGAPIRRRGAACASPVRLGPVRAFARRAADRWALIRCGGFAASRRKEGR